jgi:hypothetical protein
MEASDRQRLEGYVRDQNFYRGVAEDVAERMVIAFIGRTLPWLVKRVCYAAEAAWQLIRRFIGC